MERPTRQAAKKAKEMLGDPFDEPTTTIDVETRSIPKDRRDVVAFGGLFYANYASEDTELVENDWDIKHLYVDVEFKKDFGPVKAGTYAAVAYDSNSGMMEIWDNDDVRVYVIQTCLGVGKVLEREEWPEEKLVYDESDSEGGFSDDVTESESVCTEDEEDEDSEIDSEEESEEESEESDEESDEPQTKKIRLD